MTERVAKLLDELKSKKYREKRVKLDEPEFFDSSDVKNAAKNLKKMLSFEAPVIFEGDRLGFNRNSTVKGLWLDGNVTPNYYRVISTGFDDVCSQIKKSMSAASDTDKKEYGQAMLDCIDILFEYCDKYKEYAKESGNSELYNTLLKIPHKGAENFYEALVFFKLSIYFLRCTFNTHITLGRFDQYMYPFYLNSKENGVTDEEIFELIEEFFISINFDTDLYHGVQQGDNGQSMVLGGFDKNGKSMYNELSEMCMKASLELKLIDPKINLRVGKNTPDEIYEFATHLTKAGLGFPQYCNDDVVVPGLVKLGYSYDDALDYTVAACWEYIIPNVGGDYPNISAFDFPKIINDAITEDLPSCDSFEALMLKVKEKISDECKRITAEMFERKFSPLVFLSIFMDGCIEKLADVLGSGTKYHNFGCHGSGISNAADALSAVKQVIYDEKSVTKEELLKALDCNFEGFEALRNRLRDCPKMGNNDDYVDSIATEITKAFAVGLNGKDNGHGGIWRAGTGSALEYIRKGELCPATADGRKAGEPYASSYSPSLDVKTTGLLSTIMSFTKFDFTDIINGGPLTIEIHDTVLKNDIGIKKLAMLVKQYIQLGGHQLQINSINRERLLDAQKHPENYPNLIVRVWGWSGYFNELDVKYQNHIIRRLEFQF